MSLHQTHYNLLISGNDQAWEGSSWRMEYDRVFEYTVPTVKQLFAKLDDAALNKLMELPTLFAYERFVDKPACVGRITKIARRQDGFSITFAFDTAVASLTPDLFTRMLEELDIDSKWEVNRSHWAVKNVDLAEVLHRAGLLRVPTLGPGAAPPRVFISYSWDSPEHQAWVAQLGLVLRKHGVDVILDQWHVKPGQDLAQFMADSVRDSDRVLLICTENYVRKARERTGGVGYEHMLLTPQLMRELSTTKFVPVVRQASLPRMLPDEMAGRLYVDLSDGAQYQTSLQSLIRDLHNIALPLPPVGRPPSR